ncbi:DUF1569 domain-containing protein [bacterium]|nr:DUF1569 domain-containing protein [bacterium]
MTVDVTKVKGRRRVHFDSPEAIYEEALRLSRGPLRQLGNLNLAQTCGHLAIWMNLSIDGGIPMDPQPWQKFIARLFKSMILSHPLPAGYKLPQRAQQILVPESDRELGSALEELRQAVERLRLEERRCDSPMLGRLSRQEWDALHCRHAELHFSFLLPEGPEST